MPFELVVATHNRDKLREIEPLLQPCGWHARSLRDVGVDAVPVEDAPTFEGNARIKALAAWRATGLPSVGDDSGLCVDALDGAPGVYSSRFAGTGGDHAANNALLLEKLADVPDPQRTARFVTVLALAWGPDAPPAVQGHVTHADVNGAHVLRFEGAVEGRIARVHRGHQGFGYDPVFALADGRHLAEYGLDEKNAISHRGQAFRALAAFLAGLDDRATP